MLVYFQSCCCQYRRSNSCFCHFLVEDVKNELAGNDEEMENIAPRSTQSTAKKRGKLFRKPSALSSVLSPAKPVSFLFSLYVFVIPALTIPLSLPKSRWKTQYKAGSGVVSWWNSPFYVTTLIRSSVLVSPTPSSYFNRKQIFCLFFCSLVLFSWQ